MRELRAESYIRMGDRFKAVGDIRSCTKLRNDNTAAFFKLSNLYYEMGEAETALRYVPMIQINLTIAQVCSTWKLYPFQWNSGVPEIRSWSQGVFPILQESEEVE